MRPEDLIIQVSHSVILGNRSERSDNFLYELRSDEVCETDKVTIFVPEMLKQTCPGHHPEPMVLMGYSDTDMTKSIRKSNKLLASFVKPHNPISTSTLCRWCGSTLQQAGIDITVFGSYSTWSASISHCQDKGLSIKQINKAVGWSSVHTFARFYRKPIEKEHFSKVIFEV